MKTAALLAPLAPLLVFSGCFLSRVGDLDVTGRSCGVDDDCGDGFVCVDDACAPAEGEGEGDVGGEGEGDVVGEGEGDVTGEGEGDVVGEGEGEGDVVGEGEGEGEGDVVVEGDVDALLAATSLDDLGTALRFIDETGDRTLSGTLDLGALTVGSVSTTRDNVTVFFARGLLILDDVTLINCRIPDLTRADGDAVGFVGGGGVVVRGRVSFGDGCAGRATNADGNGGGGYGTRGGDGLEGAGGDVDGDFSLRRFLAGNAGGNAGLNSGGSGGPALYIGSGGDVTLEGVLDAHGGDDDGGGGGSGGAILVEAVGSVVFGGALADHVDVSGGARADGGGVGGSGRVHLRAAGFIGDAAVTCPSLIVKNPLAPPSSASFTQRDLIVLDRGQGSCGPDVCFFPFTPSSTFGEQISAAGHRALAATDDGTTRQVLAFDDENPPGQAPLSALAFPHRDVVATGAGGAAIDDRDGTVHAGPRTLDSNNKRVVALAALAAFVDFEGSRVVIGLTEEGVLRELIPNRVPTAIADGPSDFNAVAMAASSATTTSAASSPWASPPTTAAATSWAAPTPAASTSTASSASDPATSTSSSCAP